MSTYCFDLDGTLFKTEGMDYEHSKPIIERINQVNRLYNEGHTIIIETGRNVSWYNLTHMQCRIIKNHKIIVGQKTIADYYIDDRAINDKDFFK
jgi:hypothetical protein